MNKNGKTILWAIFVMATVLIISLSLANAAPKAKPKPNSCSDTDGGNVITIFGTVSGYYNNVYYSNGDYCVDIGNILEYFCAGTLKSSSQQSCGTDTYGADYCSNDDLFHDFTDYYCTSGACGSSTTPELIEDCGTDGYGTNYCQYDDVYHDWIDNYCSGADCGFTETPALVEDCGTDGYGANYCQYDDVYHDWVDRYCSGGDCDSTSTPTYIETCTSPYVCSAGNCTIPNSCSDTDGGWVLITQGTVSGYYFGNPYNNTDYCLDSSTLKEYYCGGSYQYYGTINCGNVSNTSMMVCSNGACI